jgi:hypothetical protein
MEYSLDRDNAWLSNAYLVNTKATTRSKSIEMTEAVVGEIIASMKLP